jgi:hypothetical protein
MPIVPRAIRWKMRPAHGPPPRCRDGNRPRSAPHDPRPTPRVAPGVGALRISNRIACPTRPHDLIAADSSSVRALLFSPARPPDR